MGTGNMYAYKKLIGISCRYTYIYYLCYFVLIERLFKATQCKNHDIDNVTTALEVL